CSVVTWRWPATAVTCTSRQMSGRRTWRNWSAGRRTRGNPMSILVDKNTRVLCQGMGKAGTFHATQCRDYGTQVVGGVVPGKGGTTKDGFPLFNTVAEAVQKTGANATMVFVPPPAAADAIMEAADANIKVIIAITEGIPVLDMARAMRFLKEKPV